jgi:hypothetical protein
MELGKRRYEARSEGREEKGEKERKVISILLAYLHDGIWEAHL